MDLLQQIWDDAPGQRVVLYKRGGQKKGGHNEFFADSVSAYNFIREKNAAGFDVWFGLALFGEEPKRTQTNAKSVKSFWLDIDVGDNKPYASINDAAASLAGFCDSLSLPLPTLVASGTGLHAHWITDARIDKDRWETSAKALKHACTRLGLRAGPERTADIASVLRIPGTKHLKDPTQPRDVHLVGTIQPAVSLIAFEAAVARFIQVDNKRAANKVFETNLPSLPSDANKIAEECAVMREVRDTRGCVAEPVWYGALQVLAHCIDGETLAHEWSNGYEGYNEEATQEKFERASEFGPTLCTRFAEFEPDKCAACSHRGRVATPLQLGTTFTPVKIALRPLPDRDDVLPATVESEATESLEESSPQFITPPHYEVGEQGVYYHDPDAEKLVPILDIPIWVSRLTDSVHECDMEARIEWVTRIGTHRASTMRVDALMEMRETGKWLASRGIVGFSPRNLEAVKNYLWACVQVYQHKNSIETVYEHFGWSRDGFVLGSTLLNGVSEQPAHLAPRIPTKMRKYLVTKGDINAWAEATKTLNNPKYMPQQFALTAALGSVLFSLMGVQGAVLSLAGDSGVGKTTIGLFGLSAFGDPRALEISPQSTERAFHELWYVANNLPVLINEAATLDLFKLSSLIYAAANGQARSVLTRNSELRESDGWQLLSIFTSNSHLLSLDEKWLNEANRRRILELTLTKPEHEMDRQTALVLHRTMADHYGVAGRTFIQFVVANRAQITKDLRSMYEAYAKGDIPAEHRFSLWVIAASRIAGLIAEQIGILKFDTEAACKWATDVIRAQARAVQTNEEKLDDILADYISDNQGAFTRYNAKLRNYTVDLVRNSCAGKYTSEPDGTWSLAIPVSKFAEFAREKNLDKQNIAHWLNERNVERHSVRLVPLGAPTKCYVLKVEGEDDGRN